MAGVDTLKWRNGEIAKWPNYEIAKLGIEYLAILQFCHFAISTSQAAIAEAAAAAHCMRNAVVGDTLVARNAGR